MPDRLHWYPAALFGRLGIEPAYREWLLETGSLTAKIRQACPEMHVTVLSERWEVPLRFEAERLKLADNRKAWVRCVLLKCGDEPLVYGRTVIPDCVPGNAWYRLRQLGNRPLGEILFQLPNVQRTPFEIAHTQSTDWPYLPETEPTRPVYARQSTFTQDGDTLLLSEGFRVRPAGSPPSQVLP
ncbi:chorismate--pyruvate lyase family protein [Hydrogenovibrio thermophilus]|uniref:Probable chorismate pyruvate-lyase n=1 Tax=Hydrogenovibrio thermophilus TaxID=265883 RepID=A0A410H5V8_9GAMM|nr:chorismate lyase [Hydrogenovibrio thermophilus]QAB16305.1 chorismate lyase [Hydrogenovibrio thermophilus]